MSIEELLEKADIAEYISQYADLKERNGEMWCLSPLTKEKTPSFSVNREKQVFYDFSSGQGGNLIDFIKAYNKCSVAAAVRLLKKYLGVNDKNEQSLRLSSVKVAKAFKHAAPQQKKMICEPLSEDYINRFEFNRDKLSIWNGEGISYETMGKYNVRYDSISNRIVFPIRDFEGNIINISGRTLDKDYKEKGLRKYTYFKSIGTINTLYGWSDNEKDIKEAGYVILFEGAKSVMLACTYGYNNSAAILTSHLNDSQMLFLIKQAIRVVFALDNDVDITKDKNITRLTRYINVEYIRDIHKLLDFKDSPVDKGKEIFEQLLNERRRLK